ncbi:glycoside hydrolase family 32 protein [Paenibacillus alkalitolerans]|uniref:glycoside hydrolase family 32 protein n=1 Tax=Paenibacillus alkalitolerans TaxID=2799335 RepID=UPI0018F3D1F4|nr:glycoside hydrolase family 32 protein [Paenibacillus alkalitolerans]
MVTIINKEKYRPHYHFSPKDNWMNDPNGMVFFNGEYHLFYQYHPYGTTWGPMHWGHAVSTDLVEWEHYPIALAPDEHGVIFSGSAVVDWKDSSGFFVGKPGLVAIFTHHCHPAGSRAHQRQSLAYSLDSGRSWIKYEGNPVLENERFVDFRDPKVFWHKPTEQWVMILASGQTVCIYNSPNLKDWTFASEFGEGIGSHDGVWECPDLFPLSVDGDPSKTKWVMFVSIGSSPEFSEGSRTQYFLGDFDGKTFVNDGEADTVRWLDHGRDNYAGVSWSDIQEEDGRRIYIGWMSNWKYANQTPTEGWRSAMTLPRELSLESRNGEITLIQRPVRELEKQRVPVFSIKEISMEEARARLSELRLNSYEIVAELETGTAEAFGFKVRASADQETVIGYLSQSSELFVDRTRSGQTDFHEDFAGRHGVKLEPVNGRIQLRAYVDCSSVEVFAGDGQAVITDLIFPEPDAKGVEVYAAGGSINLHSLEIYTLRPIKGEVAV